MRILYAASNNINAKVQLSRFLSAMKGSTHTIKVAAYKKSSPRNQSIDWTLDCLLNLYQPEFINLNNDNLPIYFEQVKYYSPDLIISDLEYFTSYIANVLNITIWQCSSSLITFALRQNDKYNLGLFKRYAYSVERDERHHQRLVNILDNSDGNFVYSHFGDTQEPPQLRNGFQWIRPYHQIGKSTIPCRHHIVAGLQHNNKKILAELKKYSDSVVFTHFVQENYPNILLKDIENQEEYFCNIKNSPLFVCQGQTSFLADAFYNGRYSLVYPDYWDAEAVVNSHVSSYLKLSSMVDISIPLTNYDNPNIISCYSDRVRFLHEKV